MEDIKQILKKSESLNKAILNDDNLINTISQVSKEITNAFKNKNKVLFCGNGGSAADAQHLAAELSGKFYLERPPLPAEALHVNTSYLTAVANDYSFEETFSRLVKATGSKGDVLIGITTSGKSANVIKAIKTAGEMGMMTVGMTGNSGGNLQEICTYTLKVPSDDTPRIQEAHILIGHIICELIEKSLFGNEN